ncbi:DUF29 domain-containing protein [Methylobacterium sp. Leaf89]|uniref:DUF29 domain-containing protein n=1 Tax=Methylobacterium sp. Leaf89 TaxID=1736245 RepID=UPI0006F70544|nr:DUF29 domain-containing protein [Methylobacterium sp. Leaf89]KQO73487.1 hypothetical protein ASF18_17025 [Methylobacterium sp. Leaf89]
MSKAALSPSQGHELYETDLYSWTQDQAALLRAGRRQDIDWHHIAEEIESLGGSQKSEIRARLAVLLQHLLKWELQPEQRKYGWRASIVEQRLQIEGLLEVSPSLRAWPETVLSKAYQLGRVRAASEAGLAEQTFPSPCPYTLAQIRDDDFYPGPIEPRFT